MRSGDSEAVAVFTHVTINRPSAIFIDGEKSGRVAVALQLARKKDRACSPSNSGALSDRLINLNGAGAGHTHAASFCSIADYNIRVLRARH